MTYRQLGSSGLTVSSLGLGCNALGATVKPEDAPAVVEAALESGITFFDTADIYSNGASEELLGKALGTRRDQVVIATKFGMAASGLPLGGHEARGSRRYIRAAVAGSLKRLGTDYIDLYQMHEPDPHTPIEETIAALNELVAEGKVRYIGNSNFSAWQVVDAYWQAKVAHREAMISSQNAYNLLDRSAEVELLPAIAATAGSLIPYFPLASGLLTGKYQRGATAPAGTRLVRRPDRLAAANFDAIEALSAFADVRGVTLVQVALGWLASRPAVATVIAGASKPDQVRANVAAANWRPTSSEEAELDEITRSARH